MAKINQLDFEIANLIAAGEVVERPSSVMKELIENSIDSGATVITAEIKRGGVSLIRVSDNGCGIDKEDLPISLKRHATSKIKDKEDLENIMTLGFRGEALAAISSVSLMTIISKPHDCEMGSMLTADAGRITDFSEVGCADGTTVVVENLFANVPARRKFLKKDATEAMNVAALVEKVALSRPDISIQLLIDGQQKFRTPGDNDLLNTVYAVYGKEFSSKLIKAEGSVNGITVSGYVGRSDNVRKNRNLQNVFINGRYVKSLTAMAAIEKAYTSYIAPEAFPTCVLFITMNPSMVDVNVHPAKLEVKFSSEQQVFEAIYYTVKNAIESYNYRPELELQTKFKKDPYEALKRYIPIDDDRKSEQLSFKSQLVADRPSSEIEPRRIKTDNISSAYNTPIKASSGANNLYNKQIGKSDDAYMSPKESIDLLDKYKSSKANSELIKSSDVSTKTVSDDKVPQTKEISDYRIIGEAFDCYLFVEYEGELLVIDKHAAHERVIFEDLKLQNKKDGRVASQGLIIPITPPLSNDEVCVMIDSKDELLSVGFDLNESGDKIEITAIPDCIGSADAEELFVKMADDLISGRGNPSLTEAIRREKALYQIACKAAIKGGRKYDASIIDWLVSKLLSMPDVIVCPHGRPVAFKLTKNELDRHFDRLK